jgi:hypothetical protein
VEVGGDLVEAGEMIDLIEEAIHTDGSLLTDYEVLDIIEELLKKREAGE